MHPRKFLKYRLSQTHFPQFWGVNSRPVFTLDYSQSTRNHHFCCNKDVKKISVVHFLYIKDLAPVVQKVDSAIHRINHYPVDSTVGFANAYPLDSNLSGG